MPQKFQWVQVMKTRLALHVDDSISTNTVPLYVVPTSCLNANLAGNKMFTTQHCSVPNES